MKALINKLKFYDCKLIISPSDIGTGNIIIEVVIGGGKVMNRKSLKRGYSQLLPEDHLDIETLTAVVSFCIKKINE